LILFQFFFFFSPNLLSVFLSTQKHTNVKLSTTKVFSKEWQCLFFFFENIFFFSGLKISRGFWPASTWQADHPRTCSFPSSACRRWRSDDSEEKKMKL
jgi:hypothetical protein